MKKYILFALLAVLCSFSLQAQDTIEIEVDAKTKVLIIAKDKEALRRLKALDINQIVKDAIKEIHPEMTNDKEITYTYRVEPSKQDSTDIELVQADKKERSVSIGMTRSSKEEGEGLIDIEANQKSFKYRKVSKKSFTFWAVDLGINNYLDQNGRFPDENGDPYRLRPINSTYVGVGVHVRQKLGNSPFSVQAGLVLDWYNFKFQGDTYAFQGDDAVGFGDYQADFGEQLKKSKLVVNYLNLPVMLNLRLRDGDGRRTFNFGIGGYVGTRINSYGKVKLNNGDKDKNRDSFYLNNVRYGVEAQFGYRNLLLFAKYDLNPLFNTDRGPELNAVSFGIRL